MDILQAESFYRLGSLSYNALQNETFDDLVLDCNTLRNALIRITIKEKCSKAYFDKNVKPFPFIPSRNITDVHDMYEVLENPSSDTFSLSPLPSECDFEGFENPFELSDNKKKHVERVLCEMDFQKKTNDLSNMPVDSFRALEQENLYLVEKILGRRNINGRVTYNIKWQGFNNSYNTWEPVENLQCPGLIEEFEDEQRKISESNTPKELSNKRKMPCARLGNGGGAVKKSNTHRSLKSIRRKDFIASLILRKLGNNLNHNNIKPRRKDENNDHSIYSKYYPEKRNGNLLTERRFRRRKIVASSQDDNKIKISPINCGRIEKMVSKNEKKSRKRKFDPSELATLDTALSTVSDDVNNLLAADDSPSKLGHLDCCSCGAYFELSSCKNWRKLEDKTELGVTLHAATRILKYNLLNNSEKMCKSCYEDIIRKFRKFKSNHFKKLSKSKPDLRNFKVIDADCDKSEVNNCFKSVENLNTDDLSRSLKKEYNSVEKYLEYMKSRLVFPENYNKLNTSHILGLTINNLNVLRIDGISAKLVPLEVKISDIGFDGFSDNSTETVVVKKISDTEQSAVFSNGLIPEPFDNSVSDARIFDDKLSELTSNNGRDGSFVEGIEQTGVAPVDATPKLTAIDTRVNKISGTPFKSGIEHLEEKNCTQKNFLRANSDSLESEVFEQSKKDQIYKKILVDVCPNPENNLEYRKDEICSSISDEVNKKDVQIGEERKHLEDEVKELPQTKNSGYMNTIVFIDYKDTSNDSWSSEDNEINGLVNGIIDQLEDDPDIAVVDPLL